MSNAAATRESAFWQFSLAFYARPGVPTACLELQDQAAADVNVLLYLLFLANQRRQLERADVARIDARVAKWRNLAVVPLRTLRRKLKSGIEPFPAAHTESFRNVIKRIELDAERLEQEWMEQHAPATSLGITAATRVAAAQANLAAYGAILNGPPGTAVATLLDAYELFQS